MRLPQKVLVLAQVMRRGCREEGKQVWMAVAYHCWTRTPRVLVASG